MKVISGFFENTTVQAWIAPIVTSILVALGGYGISIFKKKKQVQKNINIYSAAEEKLIEILRPFFIQKLRLDKSVIEDTRSAIIREFGLEDNIFIKIDDIKNIIILDILKTRFIKEEDKKNLIESTYKVFDSFELNNNDENEGENIDNKGKKMSLNKLDLEKNYLKDKNLEIQKYNSNLAAIITIIMGIILATLLIKPEYLRNIGSELKNSSEIIISIIVLTVTLISVCTTEITYKRFKNRNDKIKELYREINKIDNELYKRKSDDKYDD